MVINMIKRGKSSHILALILSMTMIFSLCVSAKAQDISYYNIYKTIRIKGYAPSIEGNPYVTITLMNGDKIIGIGETKIDSGGRYEYIFRAPKMDNTAVLRVKYAGEDITSTVYDAIMQTSTFAQLPYTLITKEDKYKITADLSEINKITDQFTMFAAQYDESGRFLDCKIYKSDELENKAVLEQEIDNVGKLKLFVWTSIKQAAIAGSFVEGDGGLHIQFGAKADNQQIEGYTPISGKNGYERFLQVKSELPEELSVVKEQTPKIINAFYVSPDAVEGDGSLERPFATIYQALDAYNALSDYDREKWSAIYLMGGEYDIDKSIELRAGTQKLLIGAYNDEDVVFNNVKSVTGDMFTEVTSDNTDSSIIERIHKDAEKIYYISYSDLGITSMTDIAYGNSGRKPKLLYNGKEATLSRYPNGSDTYISNVLSNGEDIENPNYAVFVPTDSKPFTWKKQTEIGMAGQLSYNWNYYYMQPSFDNELNHVNVPSSQSSTIAERIPNHPEERSHFHYFNVFEEMDMPGEWCYSDTEKRVYIYPKGDIASAEIALRGDLTEYAFNLKGVNDIVIDGITFEMFRNTINAEACIDTVIQNCEFKNVVRSVFIKACKNTGVLSSDFRNVYTGVSIRGNYADNQNLEPMHNFVQDCYFNGVENDCTSIMYSSGNIISHNRAENFTGFFSAVFYASENIIEYNEAYAGGFNGNEDYIIYIDGHYDVRANHIRYNYFHDMSPDPTKIISGLVICMDDISEEQYVYGNVIENVYGGIYANGGDNHIVDGNYIIDCNAPNLWCSISMSDYMYRDVNTLGKILLDDVKTKLNMSAYYSLNLGNSKWGQRYPHAVTRANYLEAISEKWNTSDDKTTDEMMFARLCTGNYVTNNVLVNSKDIEINPFPVDDTDVSDKFIQTTDPANGVTQDKYGNDYNVMWHTTSQDSINRSDIPVINKAGPVREHTYEDSPVIEFDYPKSIHTQANLNIWEACWNKFDKANFYKLIVATDADFTNIVSEKWLFENRGILTFGDYDASTDMYYYKVQAFNAGMGEGSLTTPIAESEVRSIERYKQTQDIEVISRGKANIVDSWMGTKGNHQTRDEVKGMLSQQKDDGYYVRFTAPAASNTATYRMIWDSPYAKVESANVKYDVNTITNISYKFRFPSESEFAEYADIGMAQWYPSKLAMDTTLGEDSNEIKLVLEKSGSNYKLYLYDYGRKKPLLSSDNRILIKTYTADEIFGRWIDAQYSIDMTTGITTVTVDGVTKETDQSDTTWGNSYKWNPESFLRFFDFALKTNSDNVFTIDVKDVNIIRAVK